MPTHLILLAAGEGSRMLSDRPKVLHEVAGLPLYAHALASASDLDGQRILVTGHGAEAVEKSAKSLDESLATVRQPEQLGTAHAVTMTRPLLESAGGETVLLYGDTPFIRPETLARMAALRAEGADIVFLGFETADPGRYGRMIVNGDRLLRIVEWKDASDEERAVKLCNSGVVLAETSTLLRLAAAVGNDNASGEHYLTDIVELANREGLNVRAVACEEAETMGINTRADLAAAETAFQTRARAALLDAGVTLQAPETVYLSHDTHIGRDAVIEPNVVFGPGVTVESGARIRAFSHLEGCHVGSRAIVGPFARLRPGAELANDVHIGNFVEVKNAEVGEGAKINHLSYVGDASVGERTNVGAGTITCNYDGVFKHRTEIGAGVFVGSNTMLVAPVKVGDGAMTATGTVVTRDVPSGAMAVARAKQDNKPGFATRFFERLRAKKAKS